MQPFVPGSTVVDPDEILVLSLTAVVPTPPQPLESDQ